MLTKEIISYIFIPILCYFSLVNCSNNYNNNELKDFAIKDTASISKFRISDTEGNTITINRDNKYKIWMIEGTDFNASKPTVDLLMETFYRIRVKQDVANSAFNTVINRLSVRHKKVEIFLNEDTPYKSWYIGSPTPDHLGTFMLLKKDGKKGSRPYVMHKPGVYGSLDIRFFTDWTSWRSPQIFHYPNSYDIQSVKVSYNDFDHESFSIKRNNKDIFLE